MKDGNLVTWIYRPGFSSSKKKRKGDRAFIAYIPPSLDTSICAARYPKIEADSIKCLERSLSACLSS